MHSMTDQQIAALLIDSYSLLRCGVYVHDINVVNISYLRAINTTTMQKLRIKQIQTFRSEKDNQFYMRVIGLNSRTVHTAEGFKTRRGRDNSVQIINQSLIKPVPVVEMAWVQKGSQRVLAPQPGRALVNRSKSAKKAPLKKKA